VVKEYVVYDRDTKLFLAQTPNGWVFRKYDFWSASAEDAERVAGIVRERRRTRKESIEVREVSEVWTPE